MPYAAAADMLERVDERVLQDLLSDDGTPVHEVVGDARLTSAMSAASGRINASVMVAGLYDAAELASLTGDDLAFLKTLTCDIALGILIRRRPSPQTTEWAKAINEQTDGTLELIRSGKLTFNLDAQKLAGQPKVDGPTAVDYQQLNLIPDRTERFYPTRGTRLPIGRA